MRKFALTGLWCTLMLLALNGCTLNVPVPAPTMTPTPTEVKQQDTLVSLTFDDGDADNFSMELVLKQYGLHATFYIPSKLAGTSGYMTWEQLQTLQQDGNEIGGHSLDHMKISELDSATLRHEVCDDRQNLIDHGFTPVSFAYPFGNYDDPARQMVKACGYTSARTISGGPEDTTPPDPFTLRGLPYIVSDTGLDKLERYVGGTRKAGGGWVILIFHHVCDNCDYFSVKPDILMRFIQWLADQQSMGHIKVKTVGEVISGAAAP